MRKRGGEAEHEGKQCKALPMMRQCKRHPREFVLECGTLAHNPGPAL